MVSPLAVVPPLVPAARPLDGFVQQSVEDRHYQERPERHDDQVCQEDVVTDIHSVVPQTGGADGQTDLSGAHVGLGGGHVGRHGHNLLAIFASRLGTSVQFKPPKQLVSKLGLERYSSVYKIRANKLINFCFYL